MIFKVGLLGASGKMGLEIASLLADGYSLGGDSLELSDAVSLSARLTSIEGIEVRRLEDPPREPVHVWIDFSRPAGTMALLEHAACPLVIGTTGLSDSEIARIREYATRFAVLLCANTSPGMGLMARMIRSVPVPQEFAVVVEEEHHRQKKDSPSGTAKMLLAILQEQGHRNMQVHVTRAGTTVGAHGVRFIADGEELEIRHRVADRKVFAEGALRGALFIARQKKPRIYSMEEIGDDET